MIPHVGLAQGVGFKGGFKLINCNNNNSNTHSNNNTTINNATINNTNRNDNDNTYNPNNNDNNNNKKKNKPNTKLRVGFKGGVLNQQVVAGCLCYGSAVCHILSGIMQQLA